MTIERMEYSDARPLMQPGDVIAFGGKGNFSELIKFVTSGTVSHLGVVLQTRITDDDTGRFFNQIIESADINGFAGVNVSRFSDRLASYDGELWWLPLRRDIRESSFNKKAFFDFLFHHKSRRAKYDLPQALLSAVDAMDKLPFDLRGPGYNNEDFDRFFCSELVAAALKTAGAVPSEINASEVTPIDLCRWNIFEARYFQLKGPELKNISRYNTADPRHWIV